MWTVEAVAVEPTTPMLTVLPEVLTLKKLVPEVFWTWKAVVLLVAPWIVKPPLPLCMMFTSSMVMVDCRVALLLVPAYWVLSPSQAKPLIEDVAKLLSPLTVGSELPYLLIFAASESDSVPDPVATHNTSESISFAPKRLPISKVEPKAVPPAAPREILVNALPLTET